MKRLTMGSLFDGIGGFPLAALEYEIEPIWASEIERFPMLVTKLRFPHMACGSTASAAASSNANALPWDTSPTIMKRYRIHSAEPRHR